VQLLLLTAGEVMAIFG